MEFSADRFAECLSPQGDKPGMTIAEAAKACGVSRRTAERRFSESTGMSIGKWMKSKDKTLSLRQQPCISFRLPAEDLAELKRRAKAANMSRHLWAQRAVVAALAAERRTR